MGESGRVVLVVDDEQAVCRLITGMLEGESGLDVRVVAVGHDEPVLERVQQLKPVLVLLDFGVHDRGIAVAERLKADPSTRAVPIVALTFCEEGKRQALAAGCATYLAKPFLMDDLLATVQGYAAAPGLDREP